VSFPIKYLEIPLSVSKLPKSALQPLMYKVVDKLSAWHGRLMHRSGCLTLIKTTLSAMPIYTSISIGLPSWVQKGLQKIMKVFLWTCTNVMQNGKCLVAWRRVQRLHELGGLNVLDLKRMGMVLHLRWLWFQRTDRPIQALV
jgi:hypothetical protein